VLGPSLDTQDSGRWAMITRYCLRVQRNGVWSGFLGSTQRKNPLIPVGSLAIVPSFVYAIVCANPKGLSRRESRNRLSGHVDSTTGGGVPIRCAWCSPVTHRLHLTPRFTRNSQNCRKGLVKCPVQHQQPTTQATRQQLA
jgi:hypothetical protein